MARSGAYREEERGGEQAEVVEAFLEGGRPRDAEVARDEGDADQVRQHRQRPDFHKDLDLVVQEDQQAQMDGGGDVEDQREHRRVAEALLATARHAVRSVRALACKRSNRQVSTLDEWSMQWHELAGVG